jgi:hypothetical protein
MSLWGNIDYRTSNLKPVFANTTNASSNSTINGTSANTNKFYGVVAGVSVTETERSNTLAQHPTHAGWVSLKVGTGTITDNSVLGQGTGANISFTTANSQNTLQSYSTNSTLNTFGTLTIVNGGSLYSNSSAITIRTNGSNTSLGTFTVTLGGRAGRIQTETLVAMGSITLDDPRDNVYYTGI